MKQLVMSILFSVILLSAGSLKADQLVILHTNDFHGHPLAFFHYPAPDVGGLPALATFVDLTRSRYKHVLVLDAGDMNTGRPESNFFNGIPDIIGYNYIGYDAVTLGNHEFDRSLSLFQKQTRIANFPFISANIKYSDGRYFTQPFIIKSFGTFSVGIFGLTTSETAKIGNPSIVKSLVFEDEVMVARQMVKELRNRVDVLIALTHLGIWRDETKGSERLAANVKGIDLIIDGHTHTNLEAPLIVSGTPIVQAWQWGLKVGQAVLSIDDGKVSNLRWEAVPINLKTRHKKHDGTTVYEPIGEIYPPNMFLKELLIPYASQVESLLGEIIGESTDTLFINQVRHKETRIGNLVADAMLWYTRRLGADFAVQNGGGIRADLPQGPIAKKTIYEVLPFDNTVMTVKLTGGQVTALFDYMATIDTGKGAFPQVSRNVYVELNRKAKRSETLMINDQSIKPEEVYTVVTNSYLAAGGDGYTILTRSADTYDTAKFQRDVIIEYIQSEGRKISPVVSGRIKTID